MLSLGREGEADRVVSAHGLRAQYVHRGRAVLCGVDFDAALVEALGCSDRVTVAVLALSTADGGAQTCDVVREEHFR